MTRTGEFKTAKQVAEEMANEDHQSWLESADRAMQNQFGLLRLSKRKFAVIQRKSLAKVYFGVPDLATYEIVFSGTHDKTVEALKMLRGVSK